MCIQSSSAANHYIVAANSARKGDLLHEVHCFSPEQLLEAQKFYSKEVWNYGDEYLFELVRVRDDVDVAEYEKKGISTTDMQTFVESASDEFLFSDRSLFDLIQLSLPKKSEPDVVLPYLTQNRITPEIAGRIGFPDIHGLVRYDNNDSTTTAHIADFVEGWSEDLNRQILLGY